MINWPEGVNKRVLRETTWNSQGGFITEETRSGKRKRRIANSLSPDTYEVSMQFTLEEYKIFINWFKYDLRRGALSFAFPKIDDDNEENLREYQFSNTDDTLNISNPDGDIIKITFTLEEVI